MQKLLMPRLAPTMTSGIISKWIKKEGDPVMKGEPLMIVETEKVSVEVGSPASGRLAKVIRPEGLESQVGDLLALILEEGEQLPSELSESMRVSPIINSPPLTGQSLAGTLTNSQRVSLAVRSELRGSPLVRRLAKEHGIDLAKVRGTGPNGRITAKDIQVLITETTPTISEAQPRIAKTIKLTPMRKTIAERLVNSALSSAHVTLFSEVDMDKFLEEYSNIASENPELELTYTDVFVKIVAGLLIEHPLLNSSLVDDEILIFQDVNVGIATSVENGLVVPVILNADKKSISEIARVSQELIRKAREGKLSQIDLTGGTFTISNLGILKIDGFTPIINPPQTAILGIGRIRKRAVVRDDRVVVRPTAILSLSFDHRVIDGADAAEFLDQLDDLLQNNDFSLKESR